MANLQVLCAKCNRNKGNKDDSDFRSPAGLDVDPSCEFCSRNRQAEAVEENRSVFALMDKNPVSPGHHLVLPKPDTPDYFTMTSQGRGDAEDLLRVLRNKILADDSSALGFNVGTNCGEAAGQTPMPAHVHLIPRRRSDTPEPRGGVRGVIPGRMSY